MTETIPKIIHFVFLNKNEEYPEVFTHCINIIKQLHPNWEIKIYNEDDANDIIIEFMPYLKPVYDSYTHIIQKADILRMVLVYLFGGFYMDMDMLCLKPLDSLLHYKLVLSIEKTLSADRARQLELKEPIRIANYMFGGVAKHSFWLINLKAAIKLSTKKIEAENDILESTGPGLLSNLFTRYKYDYPEIVLLNNNDRICMAKGHYEVACYFGNYAAHLHRGTWRWGVAYSTQNQQINTHIEPTKHISSAVKVIEKSLKLQNQEKYRLKVLFDKKKLNNSTLSLLYKLNKIKISKKIRLIFNIDFLYKKKIDDGLINIFYSDYATYTRVQIGIINKYCKAFIVLTEYTKGKFKELGMTIPIFVIAPGFLRLKRNFYEEITDVTFNIGYTVNDPSSFFIKELLTACGQLLCTQIPNIRLMLCGDTDAISYLTKNQEKSFLTISGKHATINQRSDWYKHLHCNISVNKANQFPFEGLESLYLGIPTLIESSPATQKLTTIGYYNILDFDNQINRAELDSARIEKIKSAILEIYHNFDKQQEMAAKGAGWIEELWLMEDSQQQILDIFELI